MLNNYRIEQKNQHELPNFEYEEYPDISIRQAKKDYYKETICDVELEMSNSLFDMRREFKRNLKKIRKLYSSKEPKLPAYQFEYLRSPRLHLSKIQLAKSQGI